MKLELILTELQHIELNLFYVTFYIVKYEVCVINSSYSVQWIILKPCILVVDILKMCMWLFDGAKIHFHRITVF